MPSRQAATCASSALLGLCLLTGCLSPDLESAAREEPVDCAETPGALYEKRVAPLLVSDRPNSCSSCHASGVALGAFVRGDACQAMACLKIAGLVDLNEPPRSVLLSWIGRVKPESALIDAQVIEEERAAFLQWFRHEAECGACSEVECPDAEVTRCESLKDDEARFDAASDPGDCGQETLERLFRGTVYLNRGRCSPCHFESSKTSVAEAPRFIADTGTCQVSSLATMIRITESGYINFKEPKRSLLLTKPLAERAGGVKHGGHDKFSGPSDQGYAAFLYFLERYASCENP